MIRALTLQQPWADAVCFYGKRVENRTWVPPAALLGHFLAIHGGKTYDHDAARHLAGEGYPLSPRDDRLGAVVAVARLVGVTRDPAELGPTQTEWWCGPIGWMLAEVHAIDPVPCRGGQGLWKLPADVHAVVRERYWLAVASVP